MPESERISHGVGVRADLNGNDGRANARQGASDGLEADKYEVRRPGTTNPNPNPNPKQNQQARGRMLVRVSDGDGDGERSEE